MFKRQNTVLVLLFFCIKHEVKHTDICLLFLAVLLLMLIRLLLPSLLYVSTPFELCLFMKCSRFLSHHLT